ncbi:MAG: DUF1080 domain-containing protein [Chloroflexi bacterium]|nr:DUF1080 domain-containing protein [Chloroflexota bacterium]MBU1750115.1 DUF1080 domain-containing protein [Chloroflexota bacterium]
MRCPNCNAWVGEDELFCGECGARVPRPDAVAPPTPPPTLPPAAGGGASRAALGGGLVISLVIVALVLVCLCLVVLVVASGVLNPAPDPTPKRAAVPTNTSVGPTKTLVVVVPTRPATVVPTRPATVAPTRPAGTPAAGVPFTDDFSQDTGAWDLTTGDRGKTYIADGQLHAEVAQAQSIVWAWAKDHTWADMVVEVDTQQVAGPDSNDYGIMFRYQDKQNFYRFVISGEGRYLVSKYVQGQWGVLVDWQASAAIAKGAAANHLKVIAQGDTFEFYANDTKLGTVTDGDLDAGTVGLEAGTYDEGNLHVTFDNIRVGPPGVAFYEDFATNQNEWTESEVIFVQDGEYHIYDTSSGRIVWNSKAGVYKDFTMEAKIRKVEGPDNIAYGMAFRLLDGDNYYSFAISGDGHWRFNKQVDNEWVDIVKWSTSDAVKKGNQPNVLRVVCNGQDFELYINDQKVGSAQDGFLSQGKVGFYASTGVHMAVDDVTVWSE